MDMKKLEYFFEVARQKSFTKAAGVCFVSQATISQQIAILEEELGLSLFYRNKKSVELTPAGISFLADVRRIVEEYNAAVQNAKEVAKGSTGLIRIGYFSIYDRVVLTPIIKEFCVHNPAIKFDIVQCDYESMEKNLLNRTLDTAFIFGMSNKKQPDITMKNVKSDPAGVCMHKSNPLATHKVLSIEELKDTTILTFSRNNTQSISEHAYQFIKNAGLRFDSSMSCENIDTMLLMLELTHAVSLLPDLQGNLGNSLTWIPLKETVLFFDCNAYFLHSNSNPALKSFIQHIS